MAVDFILGKTAASALEENIADDKKRRRADREGRR
jgi:hypothetical protein